jgi:hypothetical protein
VWGADEKGVAIVDGYVYRKKPSLIKPERLTLSMEADMRRLTAPTTVIDERVLTRDINFQG